MVYILQQSVAGMRCCVSGCIRKRFWVSLLHQASKWFVCDEIMWSARIYTDGETQIVPRHNLGSITWTKLKRVQAGRSKIKDNTISFTQVLLIPVVLISNQGKILCCRSPSSWNVKSGGWNWYFLFFHALYILVWIREVGMSCGASSHTQTITEVLASIL